MFKKILLFVLFINVLISCDVSAKNTARVLSVIPGVNSTLDGKTTTLAMKMDVSIKSDIVSDKTGKAQFMFADGSTVSISPDTKISLLEFNDEPEKENVIINLATGAMRIITGEVSRRNPNAFNINTPQASIGVRGTIVSIAVKGDETKIYLTETSGKGVSVTDRATGKTLNLRAPGNIITVSPQGMEQRKPVKGEVAALNNNVKQMQTMSVSVANNNISNPAAKMDNLNNGVVIEKEAKLAASLNNIDQKIENNTNIVKPDKPNQNPVNPPAAGTGGGSSSDPVNPPASSVAISTITPATVTGRPLTLTPLVKKYMDMPGWNPDNGVDGKNEWVLSGRVVIPTTGKLKQDGATSFDMDIVAQTMPFVPYKGVYVESDDKVWIGPMKLNPYSNILKYDKKTGLYTGASEFGGIVILHDGVLITDKNTWVQNDNRVLSNITENDKMNEIAALAANSEIINSDNGTFSRISDSLFRYASKSGKNDYLIKIISDSEVIFIAENYKFDERVLNNSFTQNVAVVSPESLEMKLGMPKLHIQENGLDRSLLNGKFIIQDFVWSNKAAMPNPDSLKDISQLSFSGTIMCNANSPHIQVNLSGERMLANVANGDYRNYSPYGSMQLKDIEKKNFVYSHSADLTDNFSFFTQKGTLPGQSYYVGEGPDSGPIKYLNGQFLSKDRGRYEYGLEAGTLHGINGSNEVNGLTGYFVRDINQ